MADEIQFSFATAKITYVLIRNSAGLIWNGTSFGAYATGSYSTYPVLATEQGTASGFYIAATPVTMAAGVYSVAAKQQLGGSPSESDPTVAVGELQWNGTYQVPLSDLATSGQIGQGFPMRVARGVMIQNWSIYMKSSADHITPLTSGIVSGQISRDGGAFGALQSGLFTEVGLGFYNLSALTSGDMLANTVRLLFTANGISGGAADPLPQVVLTQRTSGF